jgi:hypothetical protein
VQVVYVLSVTLFSLFSHFISYQTPSPLNVIPPRGRGPTALTTWNYILPSDARRCWPSVVGPRHRIARRRRGLHPRRYVDILPLVLFLPFAIVMMNCIRPVPTS